MEQKKKKKHGTLLFSQLEGPWGLPPGVKKPSIFETFKLYIEERREEKAEAREKRAKWRAKMRACLAETFPGLKKAENTGKPEMKSGQSMLSIAPNVIEVEAPEELSFFEKQRRTQLIEDRYGKYPSFNIEPFPYERQRVANRMSPEDRMRRQEFLRAQLLHPDEPIGDRYRPINPIRRVYRIPLDRFETLLRVRYGTEKAYYTRIHVGGFAVALAATYFMFYWIKYNQQTWEKPGWKVYRTLPVVYGEPGKRRIDYGDFRFSERTAMRDMKTSLTAPQVPGDY